MTGPIDLALTLAEIFERVGIVYALGGSLASSFLGEPRTTVDVDFATRFPDRLLEPFFETVGPEFYVPVEFARLAVAASTSFNLIQLSSGLKADVFVLGNELLDERQIERRVRMTARRDPDRSLWITSAVDQVLRKLHWYQSGGSLSDRQWRDVVGLLSVQAQSIDLADLRATAHMLQLDDLVERAISDSQDR